MCRSAADHGARVGSPWPALCRGRNEADQESRPAPLRTWPQWWHGHLPAGDPRSDHTPLRRAVAKRMSCRYSASWRDLPGGCHRRLGGCWFTRRLRHHPISTTSATRPADPIKDENIPKSALTARTPEYSPGRKGKLERTKDETWFAGDMTL